MSSIHRFSQPWIKNIQGTFLFLYKTCTDLFFPLVIILNNTVEQLFTTAFYTVYTAVSLTGNLEET